MKIAVLLLCAPLILFASQDLQIKSPEKNNRNKRALITGVSRGIGYALAQNLLDRGIEVVGVSRADKSCLKELLLNSKFTYLSADLTTNEGIFELQEFLRTNGYSFDYIVHNAAMMMPPCKMQDMNLRDMEQTIKLNLIVPMKLTRILSPFYRPKVRILNITSRAATTAVPEVGPYCISKAGLDMLTKILKKELLDRDIAISAVIPGEVDTEIQNILRTTNSFHLKEKFDENYNQGKLISPHMCADFLSWLLCEISFDEFNAKEIPWNIYDADHQKYWLKGTLPAFPF
jgi:short-subunit dehydrogenase